MIKSHLNRFSWDTFSARSWNVLMCVCATVFEKGDILREIKRPLRRIAMISWIAVWNMLWFSKLIWMYQVQAKHKGSLVSIFPSASSPHAAWVVSGSLCDGGPAGVLEGWLTGSGAAVCSPLPFLLWSPLCSSHLITNDCTSQRNFPFSIFSHPGPTPTSKTSGALQLSDRRRRHPNQAVTQQLAWYFSHTSMTQLPREEKAILWFCDTVNYNEAACVKVYSFKWWVISP